MTAEEKGESKGNIFSDTLFYYFIILFYFILFYFIKNVVKYNQ